MLGAGISPTGGRRDPVLTMGATGLGCAEPGKPARPTIPTRKWRYIGTSPSLETRRRVAAALLDKLADGRSSRIDTGARGLDWVGEREGPVGPSTAAEPETGFAPARYTRP